MASLLGSSIVLSLLAVICLTALGVESAESSLKFVSVIFRHGDRTPDNNGWEMYPKDPYLNYNFYPTGLGQLTNQGKLREYKLGEVLRRRYVDYLGKVYTPNSVYGLSSDYDRTKMSLQLVLAGLYPPVPSQRWNILMNWQPIPTQYLRRIEDNLFLSDECPLYKMEYDRVVNSAEGKKAMSQFSDLIEDLTEKTGKNMSTPLDLYYLYHTLMAESSMNLPLPDWANKIFPYGRLFDATVVAYDLANNNTLLKKLYIGRYLKTITENMVAIQNGTLEDRRKIYLYSGHETNIASMLHALGVYKPHVPAYSSAVFTELHYLYGKYYVKFLHYVGIPAVVNELKIPNCDRYCPLEQFLDMISDLIPSEEELSCDKSLTSDYSNYKLPVQTESMTYNLLKTAKIWGS